MGDKREEMKECALCDRPAQMYCESDQASLCWGCDGKVHGANFLVARHSRNLLCHVCQSLTPWHASGARLGPTVSVCKSCVGRSDRALQQQEEGSGDHEHEVHDADVEDDDYNDEMDGDDEEEEEWGEEEQDEEDGENQVVPWSSTPPPVPSSSSSEDSTSRLAGGSTEAALPSKRRRENADLLFVSDVDCAADEEATSLASFRATKERKKELILSSDSRSAVIESVLRFQREKGCRDNGVLEICKRSKDPNTRSR